MCQLFYAKPLIEPSLPKVAGRNVIAPWAAVAVRVLGIEALAHPNISVQAAPKDIPFTARVLLLTIAGVSLAASPT